MTVWFVATNAGVLLEFTIGAGVEVEMKAFVVNFSAVGRSYFKYDWGITFRWESLRGNEYASPLLKINGCGVVAIAHRQAHGYGNRVDGFDVIIDKCNPRMSILWLHPELKVRVHTGNQFSSIGSGNGMAVMVHLPLVSV